MNTIKQHTQFRIYVIFLIALLCLSNISVLKAQEQQQKSFKALSEEAQISVLFSSPLDTTMFSFFGHSALRVKDPVLDLDYVFNYGIFEITSPGSTTYNLIKGTLASDLWVLDFPTVLEATRKENRTMEECVLNLSPEETQQLWFALIDNAKPENRRYTFDFFNKNCTTFIYKIIKRNLNGEIVYSDELLANDQLSLRQILNKYAVSYPWFIVYTDLVLGTPMDENVSLEETFFVPKELQTAFLSARVKDANGNYKPLFASSTIILEKTEEKTETSALTPFIWSIIALSLVAFLTLIEGMKKKYFRWFDCILYTIAGLAGSYMVMTTIINAGWYNFPNWNLLWLHPLHFLGLIAAIPKRPIKIGYYYHIINAFLLCFMILGVFFIPQHYNAVFIPFILCLLIRSTAYIFQYKR
ncbi:DUF4105 domain-containing protein [Bacteroidales bacterium OttesenSCG-928-I14]|nr:DUF4105 domain-containing protein [Bacteroidales bacterium OttesenSCG-928-I14]